MESWRELQFCGPLCSEIGTESMPLKPLKEWTQEQSQLLGITGGLYNRGLEGYPQNFTEAFRCYLAGAHMNNLACQYNVGLWYYKGKGVAKDRSLALHWLSRAARQGHPKALRLLAHVLANSSEESESGG